MNKEFQPVGFQRFKADFKDVKLKAFVLCEAVKPPKTAEQKLKDALKI
jgi:hypothetical protein